MKTITLTLKNSMNGSSLRAFLLLPFVLACFALSPTAQGTCQQGCDIDHANTFLGDDALINNTTGFSNTAIGFEALLENTKGWANTATGVAALQLNTIGIANTASGYFTLGQNTIGNSNAGFGNAALASNRTGNDNTAMGHGALLDSSTGSNNTAIGSFALSSNIIGSSNIALGYQAGQNLTTGSNNIDVGNAGAANESNKIRIGTNGIHTNTFIAGISGVTVADGVGVIIDARGHLGTVVSSERFKDEIKPMDKASEAILALNPVTFRYKKELDPDGIPQFGLVAEEVEKVNPDLVARDTDKKAYAVRYEAVNAMLLNEFLKEHHIVQEQEKRIDALTAQLKAQAARIQKVSAQIEVTKPAPQVVNNNQ